MPGPITSISHVPPVADAGVARTSAKAGDFASFLNGAINTVEHSRTQAAGAIDRLIAGEGADMHTTALAVQRAELQLEMFVQVRNKVVQAYQEIMRMQV
jgi:flagellar hook-basal body complex protein FliE